MRVAPSISRGPRTLYFLPYRRPDLPIPFGNLDGSDTHKMLSLPMSELSSCAVTFTRVNARETEAFRMRAVKVGVTGEIVHANSISELPESTELIKICSLRERYSCVGEDEL